jgi:hypothetical protein
MSHKKFSSRFIFTREANLYGKFHVAKQKINIYT